MEGGKKMFNLDVIKDYMKSKDELTEDQQQALDLFNEKCKYVKKVKDIENTNYSFYKLDPDAIKQVLEEKNATGFSEINFKPYELRFFKYGSIRNSKLPF